MEGSSPKIDKSKLNPSVSIPESSSEKLKENLKNNIQKQNANEHLNSHTDLLNNIKSEYTIKILFYHLDEKIKLKSIKYNKKLQNIIDINIINYKFYSGRYIIYDTNGKGREYSGEDDKLIFEGEYLNGKKNGKGKEYYSNGELFYEGEYLNGKINGKGKEYNYDGILIFEGEYLNGKRNGKGKKYLNSKIEFETEYLNGLNLTNKVYDKNGKLYEISKNMKGLTLCAHMRRSREMLFHILMKGPL